MIRIFVRILLAALFLFAGTVHLRNPAFFLPIMPPAIPYPILCVIISGVFELLGGLGLLVPLRLIPNPDRLGADTFAHRRFPGEHLHGRGRM